MSCRSQLRVVFLSGQDSCRCGDIERDQTSCAIMDIPVGHTKTQMKMKTQDKFRFFVRMTSNLRENVDRAIVLLGPAVEACMSEVDEYSVPNQQKVCNSLMHTDPLIALPVGRLPRTTRKAICR
jgi:hypothetical protein